MVPRRLLEVAGALMEMSVYLGSELSDKADSAGQ